MEEDLERSALEFHSRRKGKIEIASKVPIESERDLRLAYTPGVAYACLAIKADKELSYEYCSRGNLVAIVTDGTRILGLGNIGPEAGMPVMEGKAVLLKKFGNVDAVPLCIGTQDKSKIIEFVEEIEPSFGAINLEDLETPKALEVFLELQKRLSIPIFHDDSFGTGIVAYAGLRNALRLVGKDIGSAKIVMNGAGSAGYGIAKMLVDTGARDITVCDTRGSIYKGRKEGMNSVKDMLAEMTNPGKRDCQLTEAVEGADVLIGVSTKGAFTGGMIGSMAGKPIVFALANPVAEIGREEARKAGAAVVATGSSLPNQVNNMLAFPGIFRGALDARASRINKEMMIAAGNAIADSAVRFGLSEEHVVPNFANREEAVETTRMVADAVKGAAISSGVAKQGNKR